MNLFVENGKPFLLIGSSGTGKSVYVKDLINRKLDKDKFASCCLYFSSNTTPTGTQDIIMSKLDKRRKGVYGPPLGKKFIVFVDDINMPNKDDVDSQPPIELLRQLLETCFMNLPPKLWFARRENCLQGEKMVTVVTLPLQHFFAEFVILQARNMTIHVNQSSLAVGDEVVVLMEDVAKLPQHQLKQLRLK